MTGDTIAARGTRAAGRGLVPGQLPRTLVIPAVVGAIALVLPLAALLLRVEWSTVVAEIGSAELLDPLGLSALTGLIATAVCLVVGAPLALVIARAPRAIAGTLRVLAVTALILPPVVSGFGVRALLDPAAFPGQALGAWVADLSPFVLVVTAQVAVSLPVLVLVLDQALRTAGRDTEFVAAGLGAGRWRVFWRVTLPAAAPGIWAAVLLCFARAIGEFGATALAATEARTAALSLFAAGVGSGQAFAAALSLVLLVVALLVAVALRSWRAEASR